MKTVTFAVPCYNSAQFMEKCIESLLFHAADDVEIIIVNDGSADETAAIADGYARDYAGIITAIHQENKGHGGAINTALAAAKGAYFKVVDSDDFFDERAYNEVLGELRRFVREENPVDLVVSNYVYEKAGKARKKVICYKNGLPERKIISWDNVGKFLVGQYMLMHALIYRTELLRDCGLELPEHTFYVDNLFAYIPMAHVRTLYYINENLYRYSIGVEGQSVAEKTMIKRIDQQIAVNERMLTSVDISAVSNAKQRDYLLHYLEIVTSVTLFFLLRANTPEAREKRDRLWAFIKEDYPEEYKFLRRGIISSWLRLPGKVGRTVAVLTYKLARKIYGFN
jgi:glycosyltransferase involved in cell wall biosynthesis